MFEIFLVLIIIYIAFVSKKYDKDKGSSYYMAGQKPKYGETTQNNKTTLSKEITKENYKENYIKDYKENYVENYVENYKQDYSKKVDCEHTDKAHIKEIEDLKNKVDCVHDKPGYKDDKFDDAIKNNDSYKEDYIHTSINTSTDGIRTYGDRNQDIVELVSGAKVTFGNEDDDDDPIKMK